MSGPVIAPEQLSHLIGLIYDAALDASRWPAALEAIRLELSCHNATLDLIELPSGASLSSATCNIPAAYLPMLAGAGPAVSELWGGPGFMATVSIHEPLVMSRTNPRFAEVREGNSHYQNFKLPQGLVDTLALPLARDPGAVGVIGMGRHADAGPVSERELAVARLLLPHLQRAATINRIIDREVGARATYAATLDLLAAPVALVDAGRRLVHANPAMLALIRDGGLVRLTAGRLDAGAVATGLLDAALSGAAEVGQRGVTIPISSGHGEAGAMHAVRLRRPDQAVAGSGAAAAIFVSAALTSPAGAARLAVALYRLTDREASVFEHLAAGASQADAADALSIGVSTVKTHLARIYDKLGVSSQAGLMVVAASLSIPVAG